MTGSDNHYRYEAEQQVFPTTLLAVLELLALLLTEGLLLLRTAVATNVVCVSHDERWNENLYKDGIHPSAEGNRDLAHIITDALYSQ